MPKKISDIALAKVPALGDCIALFRSKLEIAHYAAGSITDYCHAIYKAVAFVGKVPEEFTQEDADRYMLSMLQRKPQPAESQFRHFVYGLKIYLRTMDYPDLHGLVMPKVRRKKRLPRVLSEESVLRLLATDDIYAKALLGIVYECGLRAFEACGLCWRDIDADRRQVHIREGKGGKDRIVPIADNMLCVLAHYRKLHPSMTYVFKSFGRDEPIKPAYIRIILKSKLQEAGLDTTLTTHSLRHSYATHLLERGEDIQTVQQRMGHKHVTTTMVYLHVANVKRNAPIRLLDIIVPPKKR